MEEATGDGAAAVRGQEQASQKPAMDPGVGTASSVTAAFSEGQEKMELFMGIAGMELFMGSSRDGLGEVGPGFGQDHPGGVGTGWSRMN